MRERLERILAQYGQPVIWHLPEGDREGTAFVQPVLAKREDAMSARTPLGVADQRRWTCIASGEFPMAMGDTLTCMGMHFRVRETMPVWFDGEKPLYWWATLISEKEAAL